MRALGETAQKKAVPFIASTLGPSPSGHYRANLAEIFASARATVCLRLILVWPTAPEHSASAASWVRTNAFPNSTGVALESPRPMSITEPAPFMLIFRDSTPEAYHAMDAAQREQLLNDWNAWYDGLVQSGKAKHGHPLEPQVRVVAGARGERIIDGPYAEAKEAIAGYFFLTVSGLEEATEIAQRCPNLKHGMLVEVRPVAGACALARSIGRQTMH